ncbi:MULTISPECIES: putative holin [Pseudomonas]|uniref:putative holin n=1 Tax=Pseudomonas TaxID=286 RepID=UPI0013144557|nr:MULTISPECIES: putative holin [Pseudomonas]MBV4481184.1 hypothetical protein [Pseudomonas khavaziana]
MIEEIVSALAGSIVFVINQDYYSSKKAIAAFGSSFLMGVASGEAITVFMSSYFGDGKNISIETSAFLTSAFIVPVSRILYRRLKF